MNSGSFLVQVERRYALLTMVSKGRSLVQVKVVLPVPGYLLGMEGSSGLG